MLPPRKLTLNILLAGQSLSWTRLLCTSAPRYQDARAHPGPPKRPDLKRAGKFGNSKVILAACVLVGLYMYPMIFKPLFGFGDSAEEQAEQIRQAGLDSSKTRPSNMPEWTSPFGPPPKGTTREE